MVRNKCSHNTELSKGYIQQEWCLHRKPMRHQKDSKQGFWNDKKPIFVKRANPYVYLRNTKKGFRK